MYVVLGMDGWMDGETRYSLLALRQRFCCRSALSVPRYSPCGIHRSVLRSDRPFLSINITITLTYHDLGDIYHPGFQRMLAHCA